MEILNLLSLLAEIGVTVLGLSLAINKKKIYGFFVSLTFAIYVLYDANRFFKFNISAEVLSFLFFVGSLSILLGVWQIYINTR